jgi:hypothetical protein
MGTTRCQYVVEDTSESMGTLILLEVYGNKPIRPTGKAKYPKVAVRFTTFVALAILSAGCFPL